MFGTRIFGGIRPLVKPHLLEDHQATRAHNCWNRGGTLEPIPVRRDLGINVVSSCRSLYRYSDTQWFSWSEDVDAVRAPVVGDTVNRTIWTGESYPRYTTTAILGAFTSGGSPDGVRRLGIPAPANAASANAVTQSDVDGTVPSQFHSWIYTYVTDLGAEGPPSEPSPIVERTFDASGDIQSVTLTTDTGITGNYGITRKRIYRTATGTSGITTYQFVVDLPVTTADYTDSLKTSALGEGIVSEDWIAPPDDLAGLIALPNGVLAGFVGRDVYFSEPYQPHAWPADYRQNVPFEIVGLESFGTTAVICTTGGAWVAAGTHPSTMALGRVELVKACIGKGTITPIGQQGVAYAGPDGLILVGPGGTRNVTEKTFGHDDWTALGMESARATYHEGWYLAFLSSGALAIDPNSGEGYQFDDDVDAVWTDLEADKVYVAAGGSIEEFRTVQESGPGDAPVLNRTMTWRSRAWRDQPRSPGAYQVFGTANSLRLLDPGAPATPFATITPPAGDAAHRLPGGMGLRTDWGFEVTGTSEITEVRVGERTEMLD